MSRAATIGKVAVQAFHHGQGERRDVRLARPEDVLGPDTPTAAVTFSDGIFTSAYGSKNVPVSSFQTGATSQ